MPMANTKTNIDRVVKAAASKLNGLGELERELIRRGFETSRTQLSNALKGITATLDTAVLWECMDIGFEEDWNKARKVVRSK